MYQLFFTAKVLIAAGYEGNARCVEEIEVIDLICPLKSVILEKKLLKSGAFGGILQNQVIIGGENGCVILGQPTKNLELLEDRSFFSCVNLDQNRLWITGGWGPSSRDTSEIITLDQPSMQGPKLPMLKNTYRHSMIKVEEKIYMIGAGGDEYPEKTWIIQPNNNFNFIEGPSLMKKDWLPLPRSYFCAQMKLEGKPFIVVATSGSDNIQLLDTSTPGNGWIEGMYRYQYYLW